MADPAAEPWMWRAIALGWLVLLGLHTAACDVDRANRPAGMVPAGRFLLLGLDQLPSGTLASAAGSNGRTSG